MNLNCLNKYRDKPCTNVLVNHLYDRMTDSKKFNKLIMQ